MTKEKQIYSALMAMPSAPTLNIDALADQDKDGQLLKKISDTMADCIGSRLTQTELDVFKLTGKLIFEPADFIAIYAFALLQGFEAGQAAAEKSSLENLLNLE